jgi:hypothetical protein
MESDTQKGENAEDYSLDEGDGVDDLNANGPQDIKYEGISRNENEQLSVKHYSMVWRTLGIRHRWRASLNACV